MLHAVLTRGLRCGKGARPVHLSHWERSARQRRVRGQAPPYPREIASPHPNPLPMGEGAVPHTLLDLGDFHERAPPCTPPYRLRSAVLRRFFRMTFECVACCHDPGASLRERSPARAPLPLGEVGATASGEGAGPSASTRNRIPSPHPSPHGRGGRFARVAGSGRLS